MSYHDTFFAKMSHQNLKWSNIHWVMLGPVFVQPRKISFLWKGFHESNNKINHDLICVNYSDLISHSIVDRSNKKLNSMKKTSLHWCIGHIIFHPSGINILVNILNSQRSTCILYIVLRSDYNYYDSKYMFWKNKLM